MFVDIGIYGTSKFVNVKGFNALNELAVLEKYTIE